jgi:hypothetical protein
MKQRMKVPYEKGVAIRSASSLALGIARDSVKRRQHSTAPWVRSPGTETWREAADLRACCWTRFGKLKPIPHWC